MPKLYKFAGFSRKQVTYSGILQVNDILAHRTYERTRAGEMYHLYKWDGRKLQDMNAQILEGDIKRVAKDWKHEYAEIRIG